MSELEERVIPYIESFHHYEEAFTRGGFDQSYAIQKPGSSWVTRNKKLSHLNFIDHLAHLYWLALRSPWYVGAANIDADNVSDIEEVYDNVEEVMGFSPSQYIVMTSPSYDNYDSDHNGIHVLFKSRFNDLPPTANLFQNILGRKIRSAGWELYPNGGSKFRLPFGLRQRPISRDGTIKDITWLECLEAFQRLTPVDLSHARYLPQQENQFELFTDPQLPAFQSPKGKAADLWDGGLTYPSSRYEAIGILARDCYFRNIHREVAAASIKRWIRRKHNGFSDAVNKGDLRRVDKGIEGWIDGTYKHFASVNTLPTSTHNGEGWLTYADINFIINVFPGNYIDQKRLFKLLCYYRPRQLAEFVSIHRDRWRSCVSAANEQAFKNSLINKRLLEIKPSYLPGRYSRKYKLNGLPSASREDMIEVGERAVHDYKQALRLKFGTVRNVIEASGIAKQTFYHEK